MLRTPTNNQRNVFYNKSLFYSLVFFFATLQVQSQHWIQKAGGSTIDEGYATCVDNQGNTYTTGYFTGNATFGNIILTSQGATDIFIAKTNNQGDYTWAVSAGGTGSDRGLNISIDNQGNPHITGYFSGTATFGNQQIVSAGNQDVFIAKYSTSGNFNWVKSAGGTSPEIGSGITIDNSGNVIATGEFAGTASFGTTSLTASSGVTNTFITKLDSTGTFQWTKHGSGSLGSRGIDVSSDNTGNIYATGQFSGDITFDNLHSNTMYNAIFLVKLNGQGQETWFRLIGAGTSNIANAIATDQVGNAYITGEFTGSLTFFGVNPNFVLNNSYSNKVFVAKYLASGNLDWATALGSENLVSASDIQVSNIGEAAIIGAFECTFGELSTTYGSGTFNSIGYKDIYISKFTMNGNHDYSRNLGSRKEDYGRGLAIDNGGLIHITGGFNSDLITPISSNFSASNLSLWNLIGCGSNNGYCSDADYGSFVNVPNGGNTDILIANCIDPSREPFDFYLRNGSGCSRSQYWGCAGAPNCVDTLIACNLDTIRNIYSVCQDVSPSLPTAWTGPGAAVGDKFIPQDTGLVHMSVTSEDGCYSYEDSVFVIPLPQPSAATITDSKGININTSTPENIFLCIPDTVTLTAGNVGNNQYSWKGPGLPVGGISNPSIVVDQLGIYELVVSDSNGCEMITVINVFFHPPLPPFDLELAIAADSFQICEGDLIDMWLYDSVSNPAGNQACLGSATTFNFSSDWLITPTPTLFYSTCETFGYLYADTTGWYDIDIIGIRANACDTDTHIVSKSIYIEVTPLPVIPPYSVSITGSESICPNDTALLVATGSTQYYWIGPGVLGNTNDSVYITQPGLYTAISTITVGGGAGCSSTATEFDTILVEVKEQPTISTNSLLICPSDSVLIDCSANEGEFLWVGPNGTILGDSSFYASVAGQYYCVVNDSDSCDLVSNTIVLSQYATPQLATLVDPYICDGDSVEISVITNDSSIIDWLPPLSGSSTTQVIYQPGTYSCNIISCGITTTASIEILPSLPEAIIQQEIPLCKGESTTLTGNSGMGSYSWWPTGETSSSITVNSPGSYVLSITDTNDCPAISDTIEIIEFEVISEIFNSDDSVLCYGDSITLEAPLGFVEYEWLPGNEQSQSIVIDSSGSFTLHLTDTNGCKGQSDAYQVFMPDTVVNINVDGNLLICEGDSTILTSIELDKQTYTWLPTNFSGSSYTVFESGFYHLTTIDSFGCYAASDTVELIVERNDLVSPTSTDTVTCAHELITLFANAPLGEITWHTSINGQQVEEGDSYTIPDPLESTTYYVKASRSVCSSDYIPVLLNVKDCDNLSAPNVFTPNGDGVNDRLKFYIEEATCYKLTVYNRWGMKLYESEQMDEGWDGTNQNNGKQVVNGTYYYIVEYCKYDHSQHAKTGYVSVLK